MTTDAGSAQSRSREAAILMCLAVIAVYVPFKEHVTHNTQAGADFQDLHTRRMQFAKENLFGHGRLPAWYPRESMGTPFWSNIQNFPFIPTRLVLLPIPAQYAFTVGVILASVLAALFTFAYARLIGLSPLAAAAAGWTFACAGMQLARVITGALPMIEAYPALPLLLWLVELNLQIAEGRRPSSGRAPALAGLALGAASIALAGHPQLGVYGFAVAGLYVLVRGWRRWKAVASMAAALGLGVGCAAFALWPALSLIARSTRTLALQPDKGDIALPYHRLAAWIFPWRDGAPAHINADAGPFSPQPEYPQFYETINYVGLLPLLAAAALLAWAAWRRGRPSRAAVFLAAAGVLALVTALPPFHPDAGDARLTLLRSPCRQTYVTTFALAVALGGGIDLLRRQTAGGASGARRILRAFGAAAAPLLLAAHGIDVTLHARHFIRSTYAATEPDAELTRTLAALAGPDGRVAMSHNFAAPTKAQFDDVGFFDSIILARPYVTLMDVAGSPPGFNTQAVESANLPPDRLAALGVRAVVKEGGLVGLAPVAEFGTAGVYALPDAQPRAAFLPGAAAVVMTRADMHEAWRRRASTPRDRIMLPPGTPPPQESLPASRPAAPAVAEYERPDSDHIVVRSRADVSGFVRVLESFDPGWRATLDGRPVDVIAADDTFLAVAVPSGDHEVRVTYRTPGARAGALVSLASLVGLGVLVARARVATPPPGTQNTLDVTRSQRRDPRAASALRPHDVHD